MPRNIIDCKQDRKIEVFAFAQSMHNKSFFSGNIGIFKDLNIIQMEIDKTDAWWSN